MNIELYSVTRRVDGRHRQREKRHSITIFTFRYKLEQNDYETRTIEIKFLFQTICRLNTKDVVKIRNKYGIYTSQFTVDLINVVTWKCN